MIRGTTPTIEITTDISLTLADEIYLTFKQGEEVIERTKDTFDSLTDEAITIKLTQEETLALQDRGKAANWQIRAKFPDGTAASYTTEWVTYTGSFTVTSGMEYVRPRFSRTNTGAGSAGGYEIKDFELIQQVDSGIILTASNASKWKLQVGNDGTLSTTAL